MRISDWSSDVCSSDLQPCGAGRWLRRASCPDATSAGRRRSPCPQRVGGARRVGGAAPVVPTMAAVPAFKMPETLDRKSVGSGKSVSVRVDLVGRRSITKKTKTAYHTHQTNHTPLQSLILSLHID